MKKLQLFYALSLLLSLSLTSCGGRTFDDSESPDNSEDESEIEYIDPDDIVIPPESFHSKEQIAYLRDRWDSISSYAAGTEELSIPYGNVFNYEDKTAKFLQISTDDNYSTYRLFNIEGLEHARIRNLLSDTTYYFRTFSSNDLTQEPLEEGSLTTDNVLPRNCYIEAKDSSHYVTNVRDLGGYDSSLGGKLKQGMMYRGGRLSGGQTTDYFYNEDGTRDDSKTKVHKPSLCYSEEGYKQLTKILGVTNEVDLRSAEETETVGNKEFVIDGETVTRQVVTNTHVENGNRAGWPNLIPNVDCHVISINSSETDFMRGENGKTDGIDYIKSFFDICGNPSNFPMYIHCYIGTDRTGCLCYLAGAVLGMSSEALVRDYLFSNFGNIGGSRDSYAIKNIYEPILNGFNKNTLAENAEAYLLSIGVTQAQIDSLRQIMLVA